MNEQQQVEQQSGPAPSDDRSPATGLDAAVEAELAAMEGKNEPADGPNEGDPNADDSDAPDDADADEGGDKDDADDADNADDADDPDATGSKAVIEHDGKSYQVPEELAAAWKEGTMLKADHTRKTMELAQYRGHLEQRDQESQAVYQASSDFIAGRAALQSLDGQYGELMEHLRANPNLATENPLQFGQIGTQLQILQHQRTQLVGGLQQAENQQTEYTNRVTAQRLSVAVPWLEKQGLDQPTQKAIAQYAIGTGMLGPIEIAHINRAENPAIMLILHKAMKYDELQSKKTAVVEKVRTAKPVRVVRPGSSSQGNSTSLTEQLGKRLATTGSMKDAERLEIAHMARRERQQRR
jgi:hypothetical protein